MLMKKFIGKPYAGKPHVRFEEGGKCDTQACGNEPASKAGGLTKRL